MPEIQYKDLNDYLKNLKENKKAETFAPVYLIYGEGLLYRGALEALLDVLLPKKNRSFNYDVLEDTNGHIEEAVQRLNTYSLLAETKVIAICDSKIFYSKQDEGLLLQKAKDAYDNQNIKEASNLLLSLLGILNLSFDDVSEINRIRSLKLDSEKSTDYEWLDKVIKFCKENNLFIQSEKDNIDILQQAIEKGYPKRNHLVITTDMVDKRRKLFKVIKKIGMIIDCSVPKGDRREDKIEQESVLSERMAVLLNRSDKTMDREAYRTMYEMTGFDIGTFSDNLEKLISYVGNRKRITAEDVAFVLKRTKKDPIYELTNAIADRDIDKSLFFLNSLLMENFHPLQILASMTNQIRKLMVIKDFAESPHGRSWYPEMQFAQFKNKVMGSILSYNKELLDQIQDWNDMLSKDMDGETQRKKKNRENKKHKPVTDLEIPDNPYPVYKMLLNSEKYTKNELIDDIEHLSQADFRLKYTKQRPKIILEEAIIWICNTSIDRKQHDQLR
jgi:DNA polymerase-3 subunit delta